ncbi:LysR family transcriptional regulator [Halovulum sp. GXIMD14794]
MLPRLGLNHLALISALAETGGVSAAAARLGITQSAASHRLREAERRTGSILVTRTPSGATLTPEGERLRAFADRVLPDLARLEQEIATSAGGPRRLVRLGQATYSRWHWWPAFLDHLKRREPDLAVDLSGAATARPLGALQDGLADVSTIYGRPSTLKRFRWVRLATDPLVAVMAPGHPLAALDYVDTTMLGETRVYTYPFATEPGFEWELMLGQPTEPLRNLAPMPSPEAVIDLVRAGFGISFLSRWAIEPELADGTLIARPAAAGGFGLDWFAVTRADEPEDGPAARLVRALVAWQGGRGAGLATLGFEGG